MEKRYRKNEIAKIILKSLVLVGRTSVFLVSRQRIYEKLRAFSEGEKLRVGQSIRGLFKNKYLKIKRETGDLIMEITPLGRKRLIDLDYDYMDIPKPKRWDGKWRMVMFDIPEKKKRERNRLLLKLKELGFLMFQKSAFLYPYECRREVEFIKSHLFLKEEVSYILVDDIDQEDFYMEKFNL